MPYGQIEYMSYFNPSGFLRFILFQGMIYYREVSVFCQVECMFFGVWVEKSVDVLNLFNAWWHLILIFSVWFLFRESIYWRKRYVKLPTIVGCVLIHIFNPISTFYMKLGTPGFGAYMLSVLIYSWLIDSFIRMKCSSLSLLNSFSWNSVMWDIRLTMPACSLVPIDLNPFICPFTLRQSLSLKLRCVSGRQQIYGFCFSQPVSLYWRIEAINIFKIITERHVLTVFIALLIFDYAVCVLNGSVSVIQFCLFSCYSL